MNKDWATKLELQSLAGILSHCSYVVKGGCVFTRRIINLINSLAHDRARGKLSMLVKSDLQWWKSFALMFNGKARIIGSPDIPSVYICTDSSLTGFGGTFGQDFFLGTW